MVFLFFLGFVLSGFRNLPGLCLVVLPVSEGNCQVGTGFSYHQSKRQSDSNVQITGSLFNDVNKLSWWGRTYFAHHFEITFL